MLKQCVDFSVHMKKQSLMVKCPVEGASTNEIIDFEEMVLNIFINIYIDIDNKICFYSLQLDIGNKLSEMHDKKCFDLKEETKVLKELLKSTREIINEKSVGDYSKKKNVSSAGYLSVRLHIIIIIIYYYKSKSYQ